MTAPAPVLIKGIPLTLGGVTYTLPPASLGTLETMAEKLDKVNAAFESGKSLSLRELIFVIDLVTACLRRNHPDIDRAVVAEHIGLENAIDLLQMCLDVSGLLRSALANGQPDAAAAQEGSKLGEPSGAASLPTS